MNLTSTSSPLPDLRSALRRARPALALLLAGAPFAAGAATAWDEGISGDLSNNRLSPTSISLAVGSNDLTATSVSGDREYVTFEVPTGTALSSVYLRSYSGLDQTAFFGIQAGSTMTVDPDAPNPSLLLGWAHFGPATFNATVGTDFLPVVGQGATSIGFTPPLNPNTYTVWLQQAGASASTYHIDFVVTAVPEPAATAATVAGLLAVAGLLRRSRARSAAAAA